MDLIEAIAILGAPLLFFVINLAALSAFARVPAQTAARERTRRAVEGGWLVLLNFLSILAILVWRAL